MSKKARTYKRKHPAVKKMVRRYLKLFVSLLFAASLSQMPHYMDLYLHVLKGALLEAGENIKLLERRATASKKSLMEYIRKHINSKDEDFKNTGHAMLLQVKRHQKYREAIDSMNKALVWQKPFVFIKNFDRSIAMSVDFKPVLSITVETLLYVLSGFLLCFILIPPMFRLLGIPENVTCQLVMKIKFNKNKLTHWIYLLLAFRYVGMLIRSFLPFSLPEIHRQYDTMGVSIRYASRWFLETFPENYTFAQKYLFPAVLNVNDSFGIVAMEFPLLNLFAAPFFFFEHETGRVLAYMSFATAIFSLTIYNAYRWKGKRLLGLNAYPAFLLLPLFSLGVVWSAKFMPDYSSMLLVCLGISFTWQLSFSLRNISLSILFCLLGLLMKPTSVIVFALYLANTEIHQKLNTVFTKRKIKEEILFLCIPLLVILLSTGISILYFTLGTEWIHQYQDIRDRFYLTLISPQMGWEEFLKHINHFITLWLEVIFFLGSVFIILGILISKSIRLKRYSFQFIWGIIVLQIFFISLIAGYQALTHMYYFIGVTPLCCLLYAASFKHTKYKSLKFILVLGLIITVYERTNMELKNYLQPWVKKDLIYEECRHLIMNNKDFPWDKAYVFRAPIERFPRLGVCFGERQGSEKAEFGFHYLKDALHSDCKIIDKTQNIGLIKCSKHN